MAGTLYLCATPIGNLKDITLRALEVLTSVPLIAAEDTRHTRKLLNHFAIKTPMTSYHQHNEQSKSEELISHLQSGQDLALVSDAGMPGISDPGEVLVKKAITAGIPIQVIPGPSAFISGLVMTGLPCVPLYFAGFLPSTAKARQKKLESLCQIEATQIFYEAPHRLEKFLSDVLAVRGDVQIAITRELTKIHEQVLRGTVSQVLAMLQEEPLRGEIVVFIAPSPKEIPAIPADWSNEVNELVLAGEEKKVAIKILAEKYGVPKREIYNSLLGKE